MLSMQRKLRDRLCGLLILKATKEFMENYEVQLSRRRYILLPAMFLLKKQATFQRSLFAWNRGFNMQ